MNKVINIPEITLDCEDNIDETPRSQIQLNQNVNEITEGNVATIIFNIILNEFMYGHNKEYSKSDYWLLLQEISTLVDENRIIKFFLPAFPAKSSNVEEKVLGVTIDFGESLAIDTLLKTARKIQAVYPTGVSIIVMSDYHTFDQFIGVPEESYRTYHEGLEQLIHNKGGDDVIHLINLSYFDEFKCVKHSEISSRLRERFGGEEYSQDLAGNLKSSPEMLTKYTQTKTFIAIDLSPTLKRLPKSARHQILRKTTVGMVSQGHALDNFLKQQQEIKHYIRLSIHNHSPNKGKYAVNLFKHNASCEGSAQLRTPWHNVILFDTMANKFSINTKKAIIKEKLDDNSLNALVQYQRKPWLYVRLYFSTPTGKNTNFNLTMVKENCGLMITAVDGEVNKNTTTTTNNNNSNNHNNMPPSDIFKNETVRSLIKEFGVVVFRGFQHYVGEKEFLHHYAQQSRAGLVTWDFGAIHKVMPTEVMRGFVNSNEGIPIHFDLMLPPPYMAVDQEVHSYEDFIAPMFVLYCKKIDSAKEDEESAGGATTFVDSKALPLAVHGKKLKDWKEITLEYETTLTQNDEKEVYFGGKRNTYKYPLVHTPIGESFDVLRWGEIRTDKEHPDTLQNVWYNIVSTGPAYYSTTAEELEKEIREIAFDKRFFFPHIYKEGDQVHVNNLTMLHGRSSFKYSGRELWRIQALPESDNLPQYFKGN